MKLHRCIICENACGFDDNIISMTTGNHLHVSFNCIDSPLRDAYFHKASCNVLIFDMVTGKCWVDGGENIPVEGCENYRRKELVNKEVDCFV